MLPDKAIKEFKEIYERVFNETLTDAEASRRANRLIDLYAAMLHLPSLQGGKGDIWTHDNRKNPISYP